MTLPGHFPGTSMPDRDWWAALWPDPAGVLQALGVRPSMTVLDLCCGDGYFTAPLAHLVQGKVRALDLDPDMIAAAKAAAQRQGAAVRQWLCADARDLAQLLPGPVDFVLMMNTFHGVPDQPALVAAVHRILKPEGQFAIVNWHRRPREETVLLGKLRGPQTGMRMAPDAVRAVVEPAGFEAQPLIELPPWHYGVVFRRNG